MKVGMAADVEEGAAVASIVVSSHGALGQTRAHHCDSRKASGTHLSALALAPPA